jgi:hypothetical protein
MADVYPTLQNLDGSKMAKNLFSSAPEISFFSPKVTHRLWIFLSLK